MAFKKGDQVEVASREAGYVGSYYAAHIVTGLCSSNQNSSARFEEYIVQYKTLVTDDHSAPLREVVSVEEVRPAPPYFPTTDFRVSDTVDVYANEGWWVGKITRIVRGRYFVYFESSDEEIDYGFEELRVHQDLAKNRKWLPRTRRFLE